MVNLGFLASGRGSNMQAVIDACQSGQLQANPAVVISNNRGAMALARAEEAGINAYCINGKTHPTPEERDRAICKALQRHKVAWVILAGYMKQIGPQTLAQFGGHILNIHPALLPKFGGKGMYGSHVHAAVLAAGECETGVTIHLVDAGYDTGPILEQRRVPVLPGDTVASLAQRVLVAEHEFLVEMVGRVLDGEV